VTADPVNVLQRDDDALLGRNVYAGDTSHCGRAPKRNRRDASRPS
jgi:hypothetical protein